MTTYTVRYNYRIRPGKHAEHVLLDEWHRCRWVWNQLVTARKQADQAVGLLRRELDTYARQAGRTVVSVPPAYTTMTCSECGAIAKARLSLSERVFQCYVCGLVLDRDRNAARTILATAERLRAGAETVRHSDLPSGSVGVLVEPESPRL